MVLRVLLFAALREAAGARELTVDVADGVTVAGLRPVVAAACPALAPLLATCGIAVNEDFVEPEYRIRPGDRVALIPPVSGG
jgi:molybdopterin converting factor subunit 1